MSYNDRFVIVCCDRFVIVKNSVLKLRGKFIEPLADVRFIAIKRKKRLNAVPRERLVIRSMARDRPSPYGEGEAVRFAKKPSRYRSAGACPPRASGRPEHGEGQALALQDRTPFFRMHRFRSFRTLMSIEKRIGPYQGPLGP